MYCLSKKTLDKFVNRVIGDTQNLGPFHLAFGGAEFATTGPGEHYASPYLKLRKLMQKRAGPTNFSFVDEWNTSKVCHRCFQPLMKVKREKPPPNSNAQQNGDRLEGEGSGLPVKIRPTMSKMMTLRGLLRCSSGKSDNIYNQCPIGGAFIDRDSNAATNIALKYIWEIKLEPNPPNNFRNLMRDTRLKPPRAFFYLKSKKETLPTSSAS